MDPRVQVPVAAEPLSRFCRRWRVSELAFFGSVTRADFGPESDVDALVTFGAGADWSLLDHVKMEAELSSLLHRPVDLVTRRSVERSPNWIRRKAILEGAVPVYVAG